MGKRRTYKELESDLITTQSLVEELQETLRAIRNNEVDALVVDGPDGQQVFTLQGPDQPYRTLMETMSEGALTIAAEGTILYCNKHFSELVGMPLNKIIGISLHDFIVAQVGQSLEAILEKCGAEGCRGEFSLKTAGGRVVPVALSANLLTGNDAETFCIVTANLTEQKRVQAMLEKNRDLLEEQVAERTQALRESQALLTAFAETIPDPIFVKDRQSKLIFANPAVLKFVGKPLEEVIGKDDRALYVDPAAGEAIMENDRMVMESGTSLVVEEVARTPNGTRICLSTKTPFRDSNGEIVGTLGITRDITERKRMEDTLRETEARFRLALKNAPVSVAIQDRNFVYQWAYNQRSRRPEEIVGKTDADLFAPEDIAEILEVKRAVLESGSDVHVQQWLTSNGRRLFLDLYYEPIRDPGGKITGIGIAVVDLTEQKLAEDALLEAKNEVDRLVEERTADLQSAYGKLLLETEERRKAEEHLIRIQKLEALGTLAGGIAHDFNNILAGIIGFTEMLLEDVAPDSPESRKLVIVLEATRRGRDLVKQILTFSRKSEQDKKPLAMNDVVTEGLKLLRPTLPTTIKIVSKNLTNDDQIFADPVQMHQILMNLCTNAAHAMRDKGGTLDIRVSKISLQERDLMPLPDMKAGEYVALEVSDTGSGMTPETLERIFDPFFTTKEQGEGTGLGLSVVHGIIKSHNGYIAVESEPEKGTVFRVYFPKINQEERSKEKEDPVRGGKERILIVDDEDMLVELNEQRLTRLGYDVVATTNSMEALAIFRKEPHKFDLVITDQTMPNLKGTDLAMELLKVSATIPIILCTGQSDTLSPGKAREIGIQGFLMKPVVNRELAQLARRLLDAKAKV